MIEKAIERRADLTRRLITSLQHIPHHMQLSIITSWIPLDQLEEIVKFQERGN
jgi:hypothetical protein